MTGCRWCNQPGPGLRRVAPEGGNAGRGAPGGAPARRMARVPVLEHPACFDRWEAARATADAIRRALYLASHEVAAAGDLAGAVALADAATEVYDSHYLR